MELSGDAGGAKAEDSFLRDSWYEVYLAKKVQLYSKVSKISIYQIQDWQHFDLNTIQELSLTCLRMRISEQASQIGQLRDCQKDSRSDSNIHPTFSKRPALIPTFRA